MAASPHVIEVSEADFQQKVIAESEKRPVVVDFWAPWCAPCRQLGPVLEAEADKRGGDFLLVKINTDENPNISQQFGIRGIPAVKALIGGKVVDEFTGALPANAVAEFIDRLAPGPEVEHAEAALKALKAGDYDKAEAEAAKAVELNPKMQSGWLVRAQVALATGDFAAANTHLDKAEGDRDLQPVVDELRARVAFAEHIKGGDDEPALRKRLEAGDDPDADIGVAAYEVIAGQTDAAFERLLRVMTKHKATHKEPAHQLLLKLMALVPSDAASGMRRKLAMALF
jgi:putative thioredoxin